MTDRGGPKLRAIDPWLPGISWKRSARQLLSAGERVRLASIASPVRYRRREHIYASGDPANTVFNIISGVAKTYRAAPDGSQYVSSFVYPEDLLGLSEEGRYVDAAEAITPVVAYALPWLPLRRQLSEDTELEFHFIVKLFHELREAQRHAVLLAQKRASAKLAMFLELQEHIQSTSVVPPPEIYLPMTRADVANFVGMSFAAVSRGFHSLVARGVIQYRDHHHLRIVDRKVFGALAGRSAPERKNAG
jgi:CRP/FNR family transcriptional regulator